MHAGHVSAGTVESIVTISFAQLAQHAGLKIAIIKAHSGAASMHKHRSQSKSSLHSQTMCLCHHRHATVWCRDHLCGRVVHFGCHGELHSSSKRKLLSSCKRRAEKQGHVVCHWTAMHRGSPGQQLGHAKGVQENCSIVQSMQLGCCCCVPVLLC